MQSGTRPCRRPACAEGVRVITLHHCEASSTSTIPQTKPYRRPSHVRDNDAHAKTSRGDARRGADSRVAVAAREGVLVLAYSLSLGSFRKGLIAVSGDHERRVTDPIKCPLLAPAAINFETLPKSPSVSLTRTCAGGWRSAFGTATPQRVLSSGSLRDRYWTDGCSAAGPCGT